MIHEVLNMVAAQTDRNAKIQVLRQNSTPALREILKYAFVPQLKFVTTSVPAYKSDAKEPEGMSFNSLFNEYRRFYILTDPIIEFQMTGKRTSVARKQQILAQILENIHPKESEIIVSMIRGEFSKRYGINKKLVEEAFPQLLAK